MSNPDPTKILFSTRYGYFLNKDVATGTLNIPSTSIPELETRSFTLSIPIDSAREFSQIKVNFSHLSSRWYVMPIDDVERNADFDIATVGSYTSTNLVLTFYAVNQSPGTDTFPATTINVRAYLFEAPD